MSETEMTEAEMRWQERRMEEEDRAEKMAQALTTWANGAGDAEIKVPCSVPSSSLPRCWLTTTPRATAILAMNTPARLPPRS